MAGLGSHRHVLDSHSCISLIIRSNSCLESVIEVLIRVIYLSEIYFTYFLMIASHDKDSSAARSRDRRDARRMLAGWKNLSKTELRAKAQMCGVKQTGKNETIAL